MKFYKLRFTSKRCLGQAKIDYNRKDKFYGLNYLILTMQHQNLILNCIKKNQH